MHEETSIQGRHVQQVHGGLRFCAGVAADHGATKQAHTKLLLLQRRLGANATIGTPVLPQ